jgi:mRNA interferase MazF
LVAEKRLYIPSRGDIVYLNFDPTLGHEQKGCRPAFVISHKIYNQKSSLALFAPITKQQKNYPFEVLLPSELKTHGVILADQIKSLDWTVRNIKFVETVPEDTTEEVLSIIEPLIS